MVFCTSCFLPFSLALREDVGLIDDFVKYSVWVDVGAVGVGFIDDLSC